MGLDGPTEEGQIWRMSCGSGGTDGRTAGEPEKRRRVEKEEDEEAEKCTYLRK